MIVSVDIVLLFIFYHPPRRPNSEGLSKGEILSRIDVLGGFLSIGGIGLFLLGIQWGGYTLYVILIQSSDAKSLALGPGYYHHGVRGGPDVFLRVLGDTYTISNASWPSF